MGEEKESAAPPLLELSLYLLLLAFFILLTNLSVAHTARLKSVTESLNATFAATGRPTISPATLDSLVGPSPGVAESLQDLGALVRTEVGFATVEIKSPGGPLEARFPIDEFFDAGGTEIRSDRQALIRSIAGRLKDGPSGVRYDVEALIVAGWVAPQRLVDGEDVAVGRAGRLAATLAAAGLTGGRVAGGLMQRDGNYVRLLVYARTTGEADVPLALPGARKP